MTLPFIVQWIGGVPIGGNRVAGPSVFATPLTAELVLLACGIAGIVLGEWLRLRPNSARADDVQRARTCLGPE